MQKLLYSKPVNSTKSPGSSPNLYHKIVLKKGRESFSAIGYRLDGDAVNLMQAVFRKPRGFAVRTYITITCLTKGLLFAYLFLSDC